jgi:signal transduction histidine kinase
VYDNVNPGTPTEFRILKADGEYLDVESTGVNMFGIPGVDGIVINTRPITERKRMEEELKDAKEKAELYLDLISHDINNVNQVAMGYLELANEALALGEEDKELVARPLEALKNSSALIENVRKLQKITEGGLKTDVIDLRGLLSKLMDDYRNVNGREVALNLEAGECCHVRANGLIRDVFANLIGNAVKHSPDDRRLEINIKIDKPAGDGERFCRVAIEDNGPGIPDNLKGKLFNRFQRGDTKAHGKGLGLYLVRSLVEDFRGRVRVEDRVPGDHAKGARFVVLLPAVGK